jgi:hypothetical protein
MTNVKEQTIPTAYSREVNVESTTRALAHRTLLLSLKPDAPPALSTQDCVQPSVANPK